MLNSLRIALAQLYRRTPCRHRATQRAVLAGALLIGTACTTVPSAPVTSAAHHTRSVTADFADAEAALLDAIADEGIRTPELSAFGEMLDRTAPDLGHPHGLYRQAHIHTFCSARAAAALAGVDAAQIAYCPLSIAVYVLPEQPQQVHFGYRRSADSAPGRDIDALLARIVARAIDALR